MRWLIFLLTALFLHSGSVWAELPVATDDSSAARPERKSAEDGQYATLDDFYILYQPYLSNMSPYKPVYFLVGADPAESKFQLSFKYRFFKREGSMVREHPWLGRLNFGYTQTSFWDLKSDSLPFDDTSYQPELFYRTSNLVSGSGRLRGAFVKLSVNHESNGQGGDKSRSTNYVAVEPMVIFYQPFLGRGLGISLKLWNYFDNSESNSDLPDYRGYFKLTASAGQKDGMIVKSSLGWAEEGSSFSVDLTVPMDRYVADNLQFYFYTEYVSVLAESLLDYRERTDVLRVGLSFVR